MCWSILRTAISLIHITEKATADRIGRIVYKVECNDCFFTYIGESKRSWTSHGAENENQASRATKNRELNSMMKQRIMIHILEMPKSSKGAYLVTESGFSWNRGTPL